MDPSGVRIGTPSLTSRGMGKDEMIKLAVWMARVAESQEESVLTRVAAEVKELCTAFPAPGLTV
jgi:glycine hydroxymethyltransferase